MTGAALRMTSYDLASLFRCRRSSLDRWSGKIAKRIGTRPSALHSTFHFGRKSRRIAWFLMLSTLKIAEVSQNHFVFDVVKFKNCCKYNYKCHCTTRLLQLQVQIYYATLHNTNYTTLHKLHYNCYSSNSNSNSNYYYYYDHHHHYHYHYHYHYQ